MGTVGLLVMSLVAGIVLAGHTASASGAFASCRGGVGVSGDPGLSHSLGSLESYTHQLS